MAAASSGRVAIVSTAGNTCRRPPRASYPFNYRGTRCSRRHGILVRARERDELARVAGLAPRTSHEQPRPSRLAAAARQHAHVVGDHGGELGLRAAAGTPGASPFREGRGLNGHFRRPREEWPNRDGQNLVESCGQVLAMRGELRPVGRRHPGLGVPGGDERDQPVRLAGDRDDRAVVLVVQRVVAPQDVPPPGGVPAGNPPIPARSPTVRAGGVPRSAGRRAASTPSGAIGVGTRTRNRRSNSISSICKSIAGASSGCVVRSARSSVRSRGSGRCGTRGVSAIGSLHCTPERHLPASH